MRISGMIIGTKMKAPVSDGWRSGNGRASRRQGAQNRGEDGGGGPDHQAVAKGVEQDAVAKEGLVPFQGKAFPVEAGLGLVERKDDEQDDGEIKEGEDQGRPTSAKPADQGGSVRQVPAPGTGKFSNHRGNDHPPEA